MFAKKNVVAAAALTLLAVGAQAQVTLYGTVDVSVARKQVISGFDPVSGKATKSSSTNVDSNDMTQSFVGIKGQEDLGNGLKGTFKLEAPISLDTGAAAGGAAGFFGQNAVVGLAGDFGSVNLGRAESLYKLEGGAFNPFGTSGFYSPTFRTGLAENDSWSNSITYVSPNLSGLTLSAQYSAKETAKSTPTAYSGGAYALSANYIAGPLGLSAVFGEVRSTDGATAPAEKSRPWLLGASYDFGAVKLFAQYGQAKMNQKSPAESAKAKGFQLGVGVPVTASGTVLASYGESKETINGVSGSDKTRDFSLGYTHTLSKRTNVYAAWINERESDSTFTPALKGTTNSFGVGVRHSF